MLFFHAIELEGGCYKKLHLDLGGHIVAVRN